MLLLLEIYFEEFFSYLPVTTINNLIYVYRFIRAKILPKIKILFQLATGFASQKRWKNLVITTINDLYNSLKLILIVERCHLKCNIPKIMMNLRLNALRHLTLPSIFLHFIKCKRSCDRVSSYCILCSRIEGDRWAPFESSFEDLDLKKSDCTFFESSMILDLDVFMSKADHYFKYYRIHTKNCYFYQKIRYADDLLGVFSSHLIRMFLSVVYSTLTELCIDHSEEYKLIDLIVSEGVFFYRVFGTK